MLRELLRVSPGDRFDLGTVDPGHTPGLPATKDPKAWVRQRLAEAGAELAGYQEKLYASAKAAGDPRRVLLVLQAMDCGGKDGTIRKVFGELNPAGVNIVLVARVHRLVPGGVWKRRYGQINNFERALVDDHVTVLKVMLHISYEEQRRRLLARLDDPTKHWKYNPGDVDERRLWPDYQAAYADALGRCSTDHAPWYVVPADHKWYRNWAVAHLLRETFADLDPRYPSPDFDVEAEKARVKAA